MSTRSDKHSRPRWTPHSAAGKDGQATPQFDAYLMPLVLDATLPAGSGAAGNNSLLMLPLGAGLLVDCLVRDLAVLGQSRILVMPPAGQDPPYQDHLDPDTREHLRVVHRDDLAAFLAKAETNDYLLLIDPQHWPATGLDFGTIAARARRFQGATHAIAVGAGGTRERVEYDARGQIRRVQRLYTPLSWPATTGATILCSVVPSRAISDISLDCLADLRKQLVGRGVLTQDIPILSDVDALTSQAGILVHNERILAAMLEGPVPAGMTLHAPGVLVGAGCRIDPAARFVPPVVIQDFSSVDAGAMLIGPVLVGSGSRIGPRAVVAQSILLSGSHIAADATISSTVGAAGNPAEPSTAAVQVANDADGSAARISTWIPADATLHDVPRQHRWQRAIKRASDVVLAAAGLVVLSPLLLIAAILVKCTSPGPLFFIHRRECRAGRTFGCIKFRTMVADAHARQRELYKQNQVDGPQFKMQDDPRVTRIGRWLRAANLDELPQLFNVLAGQMSLVGPRPSPFRENQICVAWRRARLSVRPGITGLWQICRDRRCDADFHQWIFYDITYVRNFSLWLDAKILLHTILSGGGRKRVPLRRLLTVEDPGHSRTPT